MKLAQSCPTLCDPCGLYIPWNCSGQNIGVGIHSLLQGMFPSPGDLPNPGIKPGLPHCWEILYQLSHQGRPRILEWVADPFFRGSFQSRIRTRVSCIAGGFFTSQATRETVKFSNCQLNQNIFFFNLNCSVQFSRSIMSDFVTP